jgi:hypothetical protein
MEVVAQDWYVLNNNILHAVIMCIIGWVAFFYSARLAKNMDGAWKKHVNGLLAQGIDPSYIKRTPEWEALFYRQVKLFKYGGLFFGTIAPIFVIITTIQSFLWRASI